MDAIVLQASREIGSAIPDNDARLNSILAGAAYKFGHRLTPEQAERCLADLKGVCQRRARARKFGRGAKQKAAKGRRHLTKNRA